MLAFSNDYYGIIFRATQSVELFCAYLAKIIMAEKLKPEETRKFVSNAFRDGVLKTTGTEINKLMPPVSRFGGSGRAKKKQGVIEKLKAFFEKYFGLGITEMQSEKEEN